jgi:hypothetical protein
VKKGIPHNHVHLPTFVTIEATGVCIPIGNNGVPLSAVYKSPAHAWNDTGNTELLSFRFKLILAGDLNAKHLFWNNVVSNPSGSKLLNLLHIHELEISAPQCPTHYSPAGNSDVLEIVVHKNVRLSEVIVSDVLGSDHYQSSSTCRIILELGIFRGRLKNSQIESSFKVSPLN